jgi:hypothetical protein
VREKHEAEGQEDYFLRAGFKPAPKYTLRELPTAAIRKGEFPRQVRQAHKGHPTLGLKEI